MPTTNFSDLYASSYARLVGQVTVVTTDRDAAEDAVQEAFGRLWTQWDSLSGYDRPEAWLRRVAVNIAISRWRRTRRLHPMGDSDRGDRGDRGDRADRAGPEDDGASRADIEAALRTLPVKQRHALLLHHVVGLPVAEVAQEMDAPEGTVKSWLFRGREALQRSLGREEAPHG
ncbi:MAG TPA: RNA polymerase sigma factor [Acidimicrobiales bacterium]